MFGIGGIEFLIIAIVTVVVIGPNELPRVLYNIGKGLSKMREYTKIITDGFDEISREGELQDIVAKANEAGDAQTDFRIEQQKAIEERQKRAQEAGDDNDDDK